MITENGKPVSTKTNIEIAMERAREEGRQRDAIREQELRDGTLTFCTDDGIIDESQLVFATTGPVGTNADGQPIQGETRIYIIPEITPESQEKDMNTQINTKQSEVQAAAEAAAPATEKSIEQGQEPMVEPIKNEELGATPVEESTLKQEPAPVEETKPDDKKFSFKGLLKHIGQKATAIKEVFIEPEPKVELDQEAILAHVQAQVILVVDNMREGMNKLPKNAITTPLRRVA